MGSEDDGELGQWLLGRYQCGGPVVVALPRTSAIFSSIRTLELVQHPSVALDCVSRSRLLQQQTDEQTNTQTHT